MVNKEYKEYVYGLLSEELRKEYRERSEEIKERLRKLPDPVAAGVFISFSQDLLYQFGIAASPEKRKFTPENVKELLSILEEVDSLTTKMADASWKEHQKREGGEK